MFKNLQNFKRIALLLTAVLAISMCASAQNYWYIQGEYTFSPPEPQGTYNMAQYDGTQVTIAGMTYTEIYSQNAENQSLTKLEGAYRIEGGQVYFREWDDNQYEEEELLYDYDLEEGDFFNEDDDHPMKVEAVTTIIDENGVERKKIEFSFLTLPYETEYWIEGIGSSRGFLNVGEYEPDDDGAIFHLLCFHKSWNVIYINPVFNECDEDFISETSMENSLEIYPNPANEIVNILNNNDLTISNIEIIDMFGRVVLCAEGGNEINVSNLPQGEYFVKINTENKTISKKLFINK